MAQPKSSGAPHTLARRHLLGLGAASLSSAWGTWSNQARAQESKPKVDQGEGAFDLSAWLARPPDDFVPFVAPGIVSKVAAKGDFASMMQPNQLWPKAEIAERLLERALVELTGATNLTSALSRFIHPKDKVAIKVNGIAGQVGHTMAVNFELIDPLVKGLIAAGVPPQNIIVYEQFPTYLMGCRVNVRSFQLPEQVRTGTHNNKDHVMPKIAVYRSIQTRYCRIFTEATAVINMTMMKDHSLCGFTGALKNITHGNVDNPHHHHDNRASPQIAVLYNHPIVQSRVRLHITDAFKITYDKGPLDKDPRTRVPHGAVYASTDPVALDAIGYQVIDQERLARGGMTLERAGRQPFYIRQAAEMGIGVADMNLIRQRSVTI